MVFINTIWRRFSREWHNLAESVWQSSKMNNGGYQPMSHPLQFLHLMSSCPQLCLLFVRNRRSLSIFLAINMNCCCFICVVAVLFCPYPTLLVAIMFTVSMCLYVANLPAPSNAVLLYLCVTTELLNNSNVECCQIPKLRVYLCARSVFTLCFNIIANGNCIVYY